MATIRAVLPGDLTDSSLRSIAENITDKVTLAGQRALLSSGSRLAKMPVAANTLEHAFTAFFNDIPVAERQLATQRLTEQVNRAGAFAAVTPRNATLFRKLDLSGPASVAAQLATLSPGFKAYSKEDRQTQTLKGNWPGTGSSTLRWRVTELHCLKETGPTSLGSDHVYMQGVMIDAFGNATPTGVSDLEGDWDSGDKIGWPDRTLGSANLDYGTGWPRPCTLVAAISTSSTSGLMDLMTKIVNEVKAEVVQYVTAAAGAYAGAIIGGAIGAIGGPIGIAVGAVIGSIVGAVVAYIIDKLWGWILSLFGGAKLFKPITMTLQVPYNGGKFGSSLVSEVFWPTWAEHSGKYTAKIDAVLSWGPSSVPSAISMFPGSIRLYKVNSANNIVGRTWENNTWTPWTSIAGGMASVDAPVTALKYRNNRVCLLTTGLDGRVWSYDIAVSLPGGPPPIRIPGKPWIPVLDPVFMLGSVISGTSRDAGYIDIFATGKDGRIWSAATDPQSAGTWKGWWIIGDLKTAVGSPVAATSRSKNVLDIFVTGYDGLVHTASWGPHTGGVWTSWFTFSNHKFIPGIGITAVSRKENQLDLFAVDIDGLPCTASWNPATGWQDWKPIAGGKFTPGTTLSVVNSTPEHIDIFGVGSDGRLWTAACGPQTGGKWAGWWSIGNEVFPLGSDIAATSLQPGVLNLYIDGTDGNTWSAVHDGKSWVWYGKW